MSHGGGKRTYLQHSPCLHLTAKSFIMWPGMQLRVLKENTIFIIFIKKQQPPQKYIFDLVHMHRTVVILVSIGEV